jgi:hypothetical protein
MKIEISIGEIVDKLTILEIKKTKISSTDKLLNINKEYNYLLDIVENELNFSRSSDQYTELFNVNKKLWDIEDKIRNKERLKSFDEEFIELSRSVYFTNDERSKIKKKINDITGSNFSEEKSYEEY